MSVQADGGVGGVWACCRSAMGVEEARGTDDGRELRIHDLDADFAIVPWVVR